MGRDNAFRDKSLKIVAVEQTSALRQILGDVLRGLGFTNVQAVASIDDAHNLLETEPVDWIIIPLQPDHANNGLQITRLVTGFEELRGTKVSLLLEDQESWAIAKAFELGLLSFHKKHSNRDGLQQEFSQFITTMEENDWDTTKTSLAYLRMHLKATKQHEDLLAFEKNVMEIYPGDGANLISLAEAQMLCNMKLRALQTIGQAELVSPDQTVKIAKIRALLEEAKTDVELNSDKPPSSTEGPQNILGIKSVVVIDHDDATRTAVRTIFSELGCDTIHEFADGTKAAQWIAENDEPGLIIMEWRVPKLTGPVLLQRIRSRGHINVPIVILSSLIKTSDLPIIRELGVSSLALKPLERSSFLKTIVYTVQQDRLPSETQVIEDKIRTLLTAKNFNDAEVLIGKFMADESIPGGRKAIIQAELAFAKEQYLAARDLAVAAVRQSGESLFALNVLGKCLMTLREYESALKCFKKAQSISPMNLERLVTMAEAQAEIGEISEAQKSLNAVKDIDPESNALAEGAAKVAISAGSRAEARRALGNLSSNINLVRYMNNKAVAHAKCGFSEEGIEIYEKTLAAIPRQEPELIAVVRYNLALAKIRRANLPAAVIELDGLIADKPSRIHKKALSLKERLTEAINQGKEFTLSENRGTDAVASVAQNINSSTDSSAGPASTLIKTMLSLRPGDHCCYLLFKSTAPDNALLKKALSDPPRFTHRNAIQRGETFKGVVGTKAAG